MPTAKKSSAPGMTLPAPQVFSHHDYRTFLSEWLNYRKSRMRGYSLRSLAKESGLTPGYLSMVLTGKRHLSLNTMVSIAGALGLSPSQRSFFELLVILGTSDSQEARLEALERMRSFREYRELNPKETEVYRYLTRWYYVAIREMAALPGFRADPEWIRSRLAYPVELKDVREALEFLSTHGYVEVREDGSATPPEKRLDCLGGVYRVALTQFHREMLALAGRSIEHFPSDRRQILGHGVAVDPSSLSQAREILSEAFERIRSLNPEPDKTQDVYYVQFALFPLSSGGGNSA